MLELDLILEPFVAARYAELDEHDRQCFQRLMTSEDQELQAIVSKILKFARSAPGNR